MGGGVQHDGVRVASVQITGYTPPGPGVELAAWASVRLEDGFGFVLWMRALRLIVRPNGEMFVRFPAEPKMVPCPECSRRNPMDASYCNQCGRALERRERDRYDLINPGNKLTRDTVTNAVVAEYERICREVAAGVAARDETKRV